MTGLYEQIDHSSLLNYLFYPRRQHNKPPAGAYDLIIPVEHDLQITCRAYSVDYELPWLLFFHGNGEVVSDYDGLAGLYNEQGLNLLVADYRGYGGSSGNPTFGNLIKDARTIFQYLLAEDKQEGLSRQWYVMGRSLGSISALELAAAYGEKLKGMIIESGFLSVSGLIDHLGLPDPGDLSALEDHYRQLASEIKMPALVIHGERDRLVPLTQGQDLYQALGSEEKKIVTISKADHNDLLDVGREIYMQAIAQFVGN